MEIEIPNAGYLLLLNGKMPLEILKVCRREGRIQELILFFHPALVATLKSTTSIQLEFRYTGDQMEIGVVHEDGPRPNNVLLSTGHLHSIEPDPIQVQMIEKFLQAHEAHQIKSPRE